MLVVYTAHMKSTTTPAPVRRATTSTQWQLTLAYISSLVFLGALAIALLLYGLMALLVTIEPKSGAALGMLYGIGVILILCLLAVAHSVLSFIFVIFHVTHRSSAQIPKSRLLTIYGSGFVAIMLIPSLFLNNAVQMMIGSNERAEQTRSSFISATQAEARLKNCEIEEIRVLPLGDERDSEDPQDYYIRMWGIGYSGDSNTSIDHLERIRRAVNDTATTCTPVNLDDYTYYKAVDGSVDR